MGRERSRMSGKAPVYLVLEDGTVFKGERLGAAGSAVGVMSGAR